MENKSYTKKIKTPDGTVLSYFYEPGKTPKLHCIQGPAIKYPKSIEKADIYAIFGKEMSKREWFALKNLSKVTEALPEIF